MIRIPHDEDPVDDRWCHHQSRPYRRQDRTKLRALVVYVPDASRSVSVAQSLLTPETREQYISDIEADYERVRELHANKKQRRC